MNVVPFSGTILSRNLKVLNSIWHRFMIYQESIIVTNGATEAIYLLAHLFEGKKSAIIVPTFREYQDAAGVFTHTISHLHSMNDIEDPMLMSSGCATQIIRRDKYSTETDFFATIDQCKNKVLL